MFMRSSRWIFIIHLLNSMKNWEVMEEIKMNVVVLENRLRLNLGHLFYHAPSLSFSQSFFCLVVDGPSAHLGLCHHFPILFALCLAKHSFFKKKLNALSFYFLISILFFCHALVNFNCSYIKRSKKYFYFIKLSN